MFNNMVKSTQNLFQQLFNKNIDNNNIAKSKPLVSENIDSKNDTSILEKIYFQPNTIFATENIECSIKCTSDGKDVIQRLIIECNYSTLLQIDKICRYFEIEQNTAIMRGLWMLSLVKEVELSNKKLGVITLDESNIVIDVSPINVV